MFEGRSLEKKRRLIEGITSVVAEVCEVDQAGVHVLIDEMSRDNWGRGGIMHRDRGGIDAAKSRFAREGFWSIAPVTAAPERAEEYLAYRRDAVNPTMAGMSGFHGSTLARDRDDANRFLVFNHWGEEADWRGYQATKAHDDLRDKIRGELATAMSIGRYRTVVLSHGGGIAFQTEQPVYITVSTHRVKPGNEEVYLALREAAVHPSMAEFDGFLASNVLESLDESYAFLIVNAWTSKEAADVYAKGNVHYGLRDQVRALLSEHSGTRQYDLVTL
jgi:4-oxalocrotonate tautomerase